MSRAEGLAESGFDYFWQPASKALWGLLLWSCCLTEKCSVQHTANHLLIPICRLQRVVAPFTDRAAMRRGWLTDTMSPMKIARNCHHKLSNGSAAI